MIHVPILHAGPVPIYIDVHFKFGIEFSLALEVQGMSTGGASFSKEMDTGTECGRVGPWVECDGLYGWITSARVSIFSSFMSTLTDVPNVNFSVRQFPEDAQLDQLEQSIRSGGAVSGKSKFAGWCGMHKITPLILIS